VADEVTPFLLFANHEIQIFPLTKANKMRYNPAKMGRVPNIFEKEAAGSQLGQATLIWGLHSRLYQGLLRLRSGLPRAAAGTMTI